jgi:hypothetical protein
VDPDSATLWIRILIGNPDPGSGSRGKKIRKFQCKKCTFLLFKKKILPLKRYKLALTTFWKNFWYFLFDLTQILISKKFENEIVFESSFLAWIRILIDQKCWIRIRIKSFRIYNPVRQCRGSETNILRVDLIFPTFAPDHTWLSKSSGSDPKYLRLLHTNDFKSLKVKYHGILCKLALAIRYTCILLLAVLDLKCLFKPQFCKKTNFYYRYPVPLLFYILSLVALELKNFFQVSVP